MNCILFIICPFLPNELQRKRKGLASINYLDIIAMFHVLFMFMQSYYRSSFWPGMVITSSNWCLYQNISGQWTKVRYLNDHGPTFQHKAKVLDSRSFYFRLFVFWELSYWLNLVLGDWCWEWNRRKKGSVRTHFMWRSHNVT